MDFGGGDQIRFERLGRAGIVTLTRQKALKALTNQMVKALSAALTACLVLAYDDRECRYCRWAN